MLSATLNPIQFLIDSSEFAIQITDNQTKNSVVIKLPTR